MLALLSGLPDLPDLIAAQLAACGGCTDRHACAHFPCILTLKYPCLLLAHVIMGTKIQEQRHPLVHGRRRARVSAAAVQPGAACTPVRGAGGVGFSS